uniref:Uncharacterized protein n=1 Tax=Meloidogyne enterolobii TaxID=390850 RepID=A0A6V7VGU2_MELEN|nr:unnamed protein product [Meloidogyne enterolobii]
MIFKNYFLLFVLTQQIISLLIFAYPPQYPPFSQFSPYNSQQVPFASDNFPRFPQGFRGPLNGNNYFGEASTGFGQNYQHRQGFQNIPQMPNNYYGHSEQLRNLQGMPQQPFFHNSFQMPTINNPQFPPHPYFRFQQRPFHDQASSTFPEGFQTGVEQNKGIEQPSRNQPTQKNDQKSSTFEDLQAKGVKTLIDQGNGSNESDTLPIFLRGAQQEFIEEYKRIIREPNRPYNEQVALIEQLVKKMDVDRQILFKEFMKQNDNKNNADRDRVDKKVSGMSENAKEQFAEISATLNNKSVPDQERWQQVLQIYNKMEPELRNEFEEKFKGFQSAFEN